MRISDWSSDVCSSDLIGGGADVADAQIGIGPRRDRNRRLRAVVALCVTVGRDLAHRIAAAAGILVGIDGDANRSDRRLSVGQTEAEAARALRPAGELGIAGDARSEKHTSELPARMRITYAVFCL